ncbi:hypothetical protein [Streptosporangium amethystogenes]|nr:hypothetical protein [Streptosporangium amethystogenes]
MNTMNHIFQGAPLVRAVSLVERHDYKKKAGSSDTAHTQDEIIT